MYYSYNGKHGYAIDKLTVLNASPYCNNNTPLKVVKPFIDILFGVDVYAQSQEVVGMADKINMDHVYNISSSTHYKQVVFGFAYPWRPYYFRTSRKYSHAIGQFVSEFAVDLSKKYLGSKYNSNMSSLNSKVFITRAAIIKREFIEMDKRKLDHEALALQLNEVGITAKIAGYGHDQSLQTFRAQALYSSEINLLIGVEGAGFVQQLFMPPYSILVIIHCKRPASGLDWHTTIAQYICHSFLNIYVRPKCDDMNNEDLAKIAHAINIMVDSHKKISFFPSPRKCAEGNVWIAQFFMNIALI